MCFRLSTCKTLLYLVLISAAFCVSQTFAQNSELSLKEIITGLQSTSGDFTLDERLKFIIEQIRVRGVNFQFSEANKKILSEAGATFEVLEAVRLESVRTTISLDDIATANDYYNTGLQYYNALNYEYAIDNFQKAIQINPRHALAYGGLGLAYYSRKDYELAIDFFTKAIAAKPDPSLYLNRGAAYHAIGSYDKAARDYTQIIQTQPTNKQAYFNRGTAYYSGNQYDKAIADFEKLLELDPKYPKAQKRLDLCRQLQEKKERQ